MQEEKLLDVTNKLELQKENENDAQNELIDLKQNVEMCNKVIINLNEELKANCIIIPELQSKIDVSKKIICLLAIIIMYYMP